MSTSIFNLWPKENLVSEADLKEAVSLAQNLASELAEIKIVDYQGVAYGETKIVGLFQYELIQTVEVDEYYYILGKDRTIDASGKQRTVFLTSKNRVDWSEIDLNLSFASTSSLHLSYYNSIFYLFVEETNANEIYYCQKMYLSSWMNLAAEERTNEISIFKPIMNDNDTTFLVTAINNYNFYKLNDQIIFCVNNDFYESPNGYNFKKIHFKLYGGYQVKTIDEGGTAYIDKSVSKSSAVELDTITGNNTLFGKNDNAQCFCDNIIKKISNMCILKSNKLNGIFLLYESCYSYTIVYSLNRYYICVTRITSPVKDNVSLYTYLMQHFSAAKDIELEFTENTNYLITISKTDKLLSLETEDFLKWTLYDNNSTTGYLPSTTNIIYMSEFRYAGTALYKYYVTKVEDKYNAFILLFGVLLSKKEDGNVLSEEAPIIVNQLLYASDYYLCTDSICLFYYNTEVNNDQVSEILLSFLITENSDKVIPTTQYVSKIIKTVSVPSLRESVDGSMDINKLSDEDKAEINELPEGSFICVV